MFEYLNGNKVIGYRESIVLWGNMTAPGIRTPPTIDSNSTATISHRAISDNCGHDLGDCAVATFRVMQLFPDVPQRLTNYYLTGRKGKCDKVFNLMAENFVNAHHLQTELKCFARLYFGTRSVSYMLDHGTWEKRLPTLETDMKAFRDLHYRQAGVDPGVKRDTLLLMEKRAGSHFANLGNITELTVYLRDEFPNYRIQVATWSDYTITEQVHIMSRTRAMIALPGSDVMNAIFFQDNTPLVMYCRVMSEGEFDTSNERKFWFDRVKYVDASTEDCNSTNVTYWHKRVKGPGVGRGGAEIVKSFTFVNFESLKARLHRLGIE